MTGKRFTQLINGPLHHPLPTLAQMRLVLALRAVVEATGAAGDRALEEYCLQRVVRDAGVVDEEEDAFLRDQEDQM